jgi:FMN phosphatase YigB (HAD superfamily)/phosphohistidine swiveling domain-containing protein
MNTEFLGISFDLWDTAVSDSVQGRERKKNRYLELLAPYGKDNRQRLAVLYRKYKEENSTRGALTLGLGIEDRARRLLAELGGPVGDAPKLAASMSETAMLTLPHPAPGLVQVYQEFVTRIPISIISNTRWTSGATAQRILRHTQLADYISSLASSDEVGWAKPSPAIFASAWKPLGIDPTRTVHIGDTHKRDHAGATAAGAVSVISRVLRKVREVGETEAHAICWDYQDLPSILRYLETEDQTDEWMLLAQGSPTSGTVVAGRVRVIDEPAITSVWGSVVVLRDCGSDYLPIFHSAAAILSEADSCPDRLARMARSCDVTCIVGLDEIGSFLNDGDRVLVDGRRGLVWKHCEVRP